MALPPGDRLRPVVGKRCELGHEPALAETRTPDDGDEAHRLGRDALVEQASQEREVDLAADKRAAMGPGDVGAEPGPRRRGLEHPDEFGLALEGRGRELDVLEHRLGRLVSGEADRDGGIGGDRLDPRRRVDRVAGEEALTRPRRNAETDEDLARVDPDPELERCLAQGRHVGCVLTDPERGPDRTLGVVLVGRRHPEHAQDRVADELLDHPAVRLDMAAGHRGIRREHAVDVFRVGALRRAGETDEVAEQRRHDLALLGERGSRGRERRAAGITEPRPARVLGSAGRALDHGREA